MFAPLTSTAGPQASLLEEPRATMSFRRFKEKFDKLESSRSCERLYDEWTSRARIPAARCGCGESSRHQSQFMNKTRLQYLEPGKEDLEIHVMMYGHLMDSKDFALAK